VNEFAAIGVGLSGMNAAQEELDVTGNNIANASTPGYVRERVALVAASPPPPSVSMGSDGVGQGVVVLGITRMADPNADAQDTSAVANAAGTAQTQSVLEQAQAAFNEPGAAGISSMLANFWSQWDTVASNPTDQAARSTLVANASELASTFNQTALSLTQVQSGATSGALADVSAVNKEAAQVATLNSDIISAAAGGGSAAGLADQRDAIVKQLAQQIGAVVRPDAAGQGVDVMVGSESLVQGISSMKVSGTVNSLTGAISLTWPDTSPIAAGGQMGALMQAANTTIPGYLTQLNSAAAALVSTVNTQQAAGVTWTGVGGPSPTSTPGGPLFTGATAATLALAPGVTGSSIAAGAPTAGPADGSNAQTMAELGTSPTGPDVSYRALVGQVGTDVSTATTQAQTAATIQSQANAVQQSSEGVNLDEELSNMLQYQNAYTASAKFLNTVNQTIQSLLAVVG